MVRIEIIKRSSALVAVLLLTSLSLWAQPARDFKPKQPEERARLAYFVNIVSGPSGSLAKAMRVYGDWRKDKGANYAGWLEGENGGKKSFADLNNDQKLAVRQLMEKVYTAAAGFEGEGAKAFKKVGVLLDKGLENPSEKFIEDGYSKEKIPNDLNVLMAEARDYFADEMIKRVCSGRDPPMMLCRSDSGNMTSGIKSDLDQTFYVYEKNKKTGKWERRANWDQWFIDRFNAEWKNEFGSKLTLQMVDMASIPGKSRFPDVRITDVQGYDHTKAIRQTIVELRLTPGAYTTYGAVLQQMQLRALGGILAAASGERPG